MAFFVHIILKYVKPFYIDLECFTRCQGDHKVSLASLQEEFFPPFFVEFVGFHALLEMQNKIKILQST